MAGKYFGITLSDDRQAARLVQRLLAAGDTSEIRVRDNQGGNVRVEVTTRARTASPQLGPARPEDPQDYYWEEL